MKLIEQVLQFYVTLATDIIDGYDFSNKVCCEHLLKENKLMQCISHLFHKKSLC